MVSLIVFELLLIEFVRFLSEYYSLYRLCRFMALLINAVNKVIDKSSFGEINCSH